MTADKILADSSYLLLPGPDANKSIHVPVKAKSRILEPIDGPGGKRLLRLGGRRVRDERPVPKARSELAEAKNVSGSISIKQYVVCLALPEGANRGEVHEAINAELLCRKQARVPT